MAQSPPLTYKNLALSQGQYTRPRYIEHVACVATEEQLGVHFNAELQHLLPPNRPSNIEFEQWEVMVREAVKSARASTEEWLDLLLMERNSQASPMERFQIISLAEAPFVLLARQAMADRGVPVGDMARPELRIVEGALQDPAAGNPNTSAAAEYSYA